MAKDKRDHLIKLYEQALNNLIKVFEENLKARKKIDYERSLLLNLKKAFEGIKKQKKIIQMTLNDEYLNRKIKEIESSIRINNIALDFDYTKFTEIDTENVNGLYKIFNDKLNRAEKGIGKQIQSFFTEQEKRETSELNKILRDELVLRELGKSKEQAIADVTGKLKDNLYFTFKTDKGKHIRMSLPAYVKMNLNTMFQQAKNTASIQAVKDTKNNLVKFSKHYWTCETCAKYAEGRVYSLDKRIKKYPYLYDIPGFNKGYKSIHPNCKHLLSGYFEEGYTEKEIEENKKLSKEQKDNRSLEMIEKYNLKQEVNRLERLKKGIKEKIDVIENEDQKAVLRRKNREINIKIRDLKDKIKEL